MFTEPSKNSKLTTDMTKLCMKTNVALYMHTGPECKIQNTMEVQMEYSPATNQAAVYSLNKIKDGQTLILVVWSTQPNEGLSVRFNAAAVGQKSRADLGHSSITWHRHSWKTVAGVAHTTSLSITVLITFKQTVLISLVSITLKKFSFTLYKRTFNDHYSF